MLQFKKSYQKVKGILVSLNVKKDKDSQTGFLPYEYPSLLQELEPRLMFDGAAIETVDIADGVSDQEQAYILNSLEQNENAHATDSLLAAIEADPEGFQTDYSQFKEVVIIDARVQDPHVLINSISRDAAIEVILNNQDGVDRIAEILEKYKDLEALHIVSYGDQSQLNLGNAILNHESILDYSSQLHKWGLSLSDESNILFYGNNLGEDESGKAFVDQMKELTDKNILTNFDRVDVANESITPLQLLTIDDITSEQIEILDTAVNKVEATLNELSSGEYFYRVIETAFMNRYDKDLLDSLKSQWISSDFSHLPEIKIMSSNQILGGYSALENIIYLNKDILTSESSTYHVLLEEIGHFIDQHINKVDSNGDEGAIFASLLLDVKIPKEYLNQLKYENDNVLVTIGSKAFNIEAHQTHANRVINVTENGSGSANFEHTLGVWYEPPGWVVIFKDRVISSGTPSWVSWNNSSTWYNAGNLEYLNQGQTTSFTYQVWTEEWTQWFGSPVIFRSDRLSYYVTFNVTGENDNPIANVDAGTTTKNNVVFVDPLANDTDVDLDGNYANFSIVSASTPKGSVSINGKQIIFDPNSQFNYLLQGQSEVVNVSYTMSDQYGAQSSSTISITVNGVNVPPEALADVMITNEESINTIDPTSNDLILDAGTGPLSVSGVSAPKGIVSYMGNTVTFNPNGEFEYLSVGNSEIVNVSYAITDSRGLQDSSSIAVVVEGRNDAPVNSVLTAQSVQEDVLTAITGLFVSDVDAGSSTINTTLSVTNGTLDVSLAGGASIISGANNSTNITLSGTITQINAALATVQYQSNLHYNGADVLTILTDDGGNNGVGPSLQDTDTVNITVAPVNDAPVNSVTTSQSVQEDVLTTITGLSVSDVDVSSGTISTVLSVANGTLNVSLAGGASIISGENNSANVTLSGTITQINAALATVQYQSNLHYNGADVLTILTDDGGNAGSGGNLQDTDTVNITVTPVNDAPVNSVLTAQSVQEDVLTTITGLSVSDVDVSSGTISTALSVTNGTLNVSLAGGANIISGANNSANLTLSGTITQINAALATVQYQSNLHYNGADVLTILTDDGGNAGSGGNLQDTDTVNITVTPVNDAPVNSVLTAQSVQEDVLTTITGLSVSDVDVSSGTISTALSVTNGTLNVSLAGGASIISGANNSANVTLSGTITQINAALATVQYQSNLHYNGADVLTILTDDGGNTGSGGNLQDTDTVNITVTPVNDAPINSVLTAQSVQEDVLTTITGLSVSDVDVSSGTISTALSVTNGTLNVSLAGGASIISGANNSANVTLSGTITQINAALATVQYQSNLHYNGADVLTILTDDGGNAGSGGNLQDTDTVNITVTPVNDAPTSINQVRNIFINETYNFQITDFPYFDVENDAFHKIIIPNTVSKPTFQKLSDALVNGAEVLASDLINISYTPIYFEKGISHTSFSYQVDDGSIPSPVYSFTFNVLVAGDINQNGVIDVGEVAGDVDKNGIINDLEIAGDLDGDGIITALYEVSGDLNGNGVIDSPYEIAGDVNGNGLIDELGEIAGDVDGNGLIDRPDEIAEDLNGNGVIGDLDEKVGNIIIHEANMKPQVSGSENKVSNEKINDAVVNYKQIDLAVKVDNVFSNNTQNILNEFGKALNERASVDTLSDIASTAIKETLESSSISDTSGIVKGLLKQAIDAGESTVRIAAIASSMLDVSRESSYGSDIVIRNIIQQTVDSGLSTDQIAQILSTMLLNTDDQYHDDFILSIVSESNVTDLHLYQMKQILEQQDPELSDKLSKEMQMIRGDLLSNALDETDSQTNPSNKGLLAKLKDMLLGNRQTQAEEMTSYDIKEHKYKIELAKAELLTMVRDRSVDDNQDRKKR